MIRDVVAEFGHLDILVNNAGITRDGLIMKMKEENRISKEQIDGMKSKWRQYKMTKKQIVNIYELL